MGLVRARIELANAKAPETRVMTVSALVDTGTLLLCIPEDVAGRLHHDELERRDVKTADGALHRAPYVGPVLVRFENRCCLTGALVLGDEVLLGAVPMEDMDVLVSPATRTLIVNPASPHGAAARV